MALRILQFGVVFAIGFYLGPTCGAFVGALEPADVNLTIHLKDPKDVIVAKGQSATFRCDVNSSLAGLEIIWHHNNITIYANDTKRIQISNGTLYIPKVVSGKRNNSVTGEYSCLVRNKEKDKERALLSSTAKLRTASIDREFLKQPANTTVYELQPTVLHCNIHSTPTAAIQWEFNNSPLPQNTRYVPLPSGALYIANSQFKDSGSYRCTATNLILKKPKVSKSAILQVLPLLDDAIAPSFLPLDISPNKTVFVGDELNLYCAVIGRPIPTVQWLNNDSVVVGNTNILHIPKISLQHAGNYTCVAYNTEGRISQNYVVEVHQKPYFNITPASKIYPSARTARLDCQALGVPEPRIYWLKNGSPLLIEGRIKRQPTGLLFSHTFTYDSGIYQCVAINSAGKTWVAAEIVIMSVSHGPKPPENVQCRPFDDTSICLTWETPANISVQAYTTYSFSPGDDGKEKIGPDYLTNQTHQLADGLDPSTNYSFYIRLYSKVASDQSRKVTCQTGTKGKRNLQLEPIGETSVSLKWMEVSWDTACNGSKRNYTVQWRREGRPSINYDDTDQMQYIVSGLLPGTEYEFRVISKNYEQDLPLWIPVQLPEFENSTYKNELPSENDNATELMPLAPEQFDGIPETPTSIRLSWKDIKGKAKFFSVCYADVKENKDCKNGNITQSNSNEVLISHLIPNTMYEFKVKAHNLDGTPGPFTKSIIIATPREVPSPVVNLEYKTINNTTACLRWQTPRHKNGKLLNYLIWYTPDRNWELEKWFKFDIPANQKEKDGCWLGRMDHVSTFLNNLTIDKHYFVLVRAVSDVGTGEPTFPIDVSTANTLPKTGSAGEQHPDNMQSEKDYHQQMGLLIGLSLATICIILSIACILLRKRCLKRRVARARMEPSINYSPAARYASHGSSVQIRLEDPCAAEVQEVEHLVADSKQTHIPPVAPTHLDTKGGEGFPNGHINGSAKPYMNGTVSNGHVHITENPQYYAFECNGHTKSKLPIIAANQYEEDSNSNVKASKFYDLYRLFENAKKSNSPNLYHQCNPHIDSSVSRNKLSNGDLHMSSMESNIDNTLNTTQLTCLDDSIGIVAIDNHRRISPVLGPNG